MLINIFHKTHPELTQQAFDSCVAAGHTPQIIDNSLNNEFKHVKHIYLAPQLYSFAAMHNWLALNYTSYVWMHNDAVVPPESFTALEESIKNNHDKVGVIFTFYDTFSWVNSTAIREAGYWDLALPQYFSDVDIYRRIRLAGWELKECPTPIIHLASQTLKDPKASIINSVTFPLYKQYYNAKWGGDSHKETYNTPFNF